MSGQRPEPGLGQAQPAVEAAAGIGKTADAQGARDLDRDRVLHEPGIVGGIDHDDIDPPVRIGIAEGAEVDGGAGQHEEAGLGLQRRRHVAAHRHRPVGEFQRARRELQARNAAAGIEFGELQPRDLAGPPAPQRRQQAGGSRCGEEDAAADPLPSEACHQSPSPRAVAMALNTSEFSWKPWNASAPGPAAVSTASSTAWTPSLASRGRLPSRNTAPGTFLYASLAT